MHDGPDDAGASRARGWTRPVPDAKADGQRRALRGQSGQYRAAHAESRVMTDLTSVLTGFKSLVGYDAAVWTQGSGGSVTWESATNRAPPPETLPTTSEGAVPLESAEGPSLIAAIPGPRRAWLVIGPAPKPATHDQLRSHLQYLLPIVSQFLQSALEVEHAANELAERYEEINLLYTISEILGRTVALEEAAHTILSEISETVGARKAAVLVHDATARALVPVAT